MKGTDFPTENVAKLVGTVRKAILDLYPEPIPEVISGHDQLSEPLKKPHIAITPLLDAGHRYADGHVMGFALWLPQDVSLDVILSLETALAKLDSLKMGRLGRWDVQYVPPGTTIRTRGLRSDTYTRDHDIWGSVTPVIFGKYPKRTQIGPGKDGGKVFAELCERVGLPRPNEVRLGSVSAFNGVPKASEFIPPEKFATRLRSHVWLRFDTPVHGPVLIGAGQFVGFGFCRPWGLS
jgi:CRISPR-associated protein Csb2